MSRPHTIQIPGLAEAVQRQRLNRDASFLSVTRSVSGYELVPLTPYHLNILNVMGNPLPGGGEVSPLQLAAFLWVLSPGFSENDPRARQRFLKRCREFTPPPRPFFKFGLRMELYQLKFEQRIQRAKTILDACREYLKDTFQDRPVFPKNKIGKSLESYTDPISFCALLAREYGWGEQYILHLPLTRIFQYVIEIRSHHDPDFVPTNPSDEIKGAWLREINSKPVAENPENFWAPKSFIPTSRN